jgi:hypothetical protein
MALARREPPLPGGQYNGCCAHALCWHALRCGALTWYVPTNAASKSPSAGHGVITGTSVPSYRRFRNRCTRIWGGSNPCARTAKAAVSRQPESLRSCL